MEDELKHYGVLGMKWGVRKDPVRAMEKASKKLNRYDQKATKQLNKAVKARYGFFGNEQKYREKKAKAERTMYKGKKWFNRMEREFGKQSVVSISKRDMAIGAKFERFFTQTADFGGSYYNKDY